MSKTYDHRTEESRLPTGKKVRAERAGLIGQHGFGRLEAIDADRRTLSDLLAVRVLRQVWDEQYDPAEPGSPPTLQERRGRGPRGRVESPCEAATMNGGNARRPNEPEKIRC